MLLLAVCLSMVAFNVFAQNDEYTVKAVFMEKFTRFIDWNSASKVNDLSKPFVISVIGENPFGTRLNEIYQTNIISNQEHGAINKLKIKNKIVELRYINRIYEIEGSDLLFIAKGSIELLSDILAYTKDKPILTISDTDGYCSNGVMINFYLLDNKIRFEINESALNVAGLKPSYMILNLAKIIKPKKS